MPVVIQVEHLRKVYGSVVAVDDVSFEVERGEIFGMVGPNGAGKTSTVECAEGLRASSSGTIRVLGMDPQSDRYKVRPHIGVQLQESALQARLKVWEALDLYASFYPRSVNQVALLEQVGLSEKRNTRFAKLSGGQKQRLFIALALVHDPEIVFLDELTTGLDPQARRAMWEMVRVIRERGILFRLQATPLRPLTILSAQIGANFLMTTIGAIILVVAGKLFYNLHITSSMPGVALAYILSVLSIFALGFLMASVVPNARVAPIVGTLLFLSMLYLSGATVPLKLYPQVVQQIAWFLPLTHAIKLMQDIWFGGSWLDHWVNVLALLGLLLACTLISVKLFRWR